MTDFGAPTQLQAISRPRRARRGAVGLIAALAVANVAVTLSTGTAHAASAKPAAIAAGVTRIAGTDRFATAVAASQDEFAAAGSAKVVVLTRGDTFPDALAGGPLAAKLGGPLLLTQPTSLGSGVQAEIVRVLPKGGTVDILGGTSAISASVATAISELGFVVRRIAGADRYATAVAIAGAMGDPSTVFEATGLNYPDALAGAGAAIKSGGAILLTNGSHQAAETAAYLAAHAGTRFALGGPAAAADPAATAIAGADRYETAAGIADTFFPAPTVVGVATGTNFADALAAGPDLAAKGAPLLLAPADGALPPGTAGELVVDASTVTSALVFGGTSSLSADVASQVDTLVRLGANVVAQSAAPTSTGRFGVVALRVTGAANSTTDTTQVIDGNTGNSTIFSQGHGSTLATGAPTRAALAALPTGDAAALEMAVNVEFAASYAARGFNTTDPDAEFAINADQVLMSPLASPTLRLATYQALIGLPGTNVQSFGSAADGGPGIAVFGAISGNDTLSGDGFSYTFDPATMSPLSDDVLGPDGIPNLATSVLTFTTAGSAPVDPYAS
jgi:putative cell wall-binding protein